MILICLAGTIYCAIALVAALRFSARTPKRASRAPQDDSDAAVTILKPVHGIEPELFENLCSFVEQEYPRFQVIFCVTSPQDPALPVIRRAIESHPHHDLTLVVDERPFTGNPKIANLANAIGRATGEIVIIADADMRVDPQYLGAIVAEFDDDRTGAVTALYAGVPHGGGAASQLAVLQLNDQFAPSVLVATIAGDPHFCFGSTMAVRRRVLNEIGGLAALAPHLADDYMLGKLVTQHGYRVVLSRYVVRNIVEEPSLAAMMQHEIRWARTIRTVQPLGYASTFVTFPLPFALLAVLFAPGNAIAWLTLAIVLALRIAMHETMKRAFALATTSPWWLLPLRDCLGLIVWFAGLFGNLVTWKDQQLGTKQL